MKIFSFLIKEILQYNPLIPVCIFFTADGGGKHTVMNQLDDTLGLLLTHQQLGTKTEIKTAKKWMMITSRTLRTKKPEKVTTCYSKNLKLLHRRWNFAFYLQNVSQTT